MPKRASHPYDEEIDGLSDVRAGDFVERDDGWWRAHIVTVIGDGTDYHTTIHWRPSRKPRPPEYAANYQWLLG